jgi:hypothetical protein
LTPANAISYLLQYVWANFPEVVNAD